MSVAHLVDAQRAPTAVQTQQPDPMIRLALTGFSRPAPGYISLSLTGFKQLSTPGSRDWNQRHLGA